MRCPTAASLLDTIECKAGVRHREAVVLHLAECEECRSSWKRIRRYGVAPPRRGNALLRLAFACGAFLLFAPLVFFSLWSLDRSDEARKHADNWREMSDAWQVAADEGWKTADACAMDLAGALRETSAAAWESSRAAVVLVDRSVEVEEALDHLAAHHEDIRACRHREEWLRFDLCALRRYLDGEPPGVACAVPGRPRIAAVTR